MLSIVDILVALKSCYFLGLMTFAGIFLGKPNLLVFFFGGGG